MKKGEICPRCLRVAHVWQVDRTTWTILAGMRKVDVRLPEKGNSNSHDARLVHLSITRTKWIRTRR